MSHLRRARGRPPQDVQHRAQTTGEGVHVDVDGRGAAGVCVCVCVCVCVRTRSRACRGRRRWWSAAGRGCRCSCCSAPARRSRRRARSRPACPRAQAPAPASTTRSATSLLFGFASARGWTCRRSKRTQVLVNRLVDEFPFSFSQSMLSARSLAVSWYSSSPYTRTVSC